MRDDIPRHDNGPGDPGNRLTPHLDDEAAPADIEADIGRTRAAMDKTLDELGDRLRPRRLLEEAVEMVVGVRPAPGDVGEAGVELARDWCSKGAAMARRHPIPAALLLGGVAWIVVEQVTGRPVLPRRGRGHAGFDDWNEKHPGGARARPEQGRPSAPALNPQRPRGSVTGRPVYGATGLGAQSEMQTGDEETYRRRVQRMYESKDRPGVYPGEDSESTTSLTDRIFGAAKDAGDWARRTASNAAESVSDVAHQSADIARSATRSVRRAATHAGDQASLLAQDAAHLVSENARIARERGKETVEQHPLAVAGALFGIGLLLGVAFPSTKREDRLFGEESDELKQSARRIGEDVVHRGKEVAAATAAAAKHEAERQGLTPEALVKRGERVIAAAEDTAERTAMETGLVPGDGAPRDQEPPRTV